MRCVVVAMALATFAVQSGVSAASPTETRIWQVERRAGNVAQGFALQATFHWPAAGGLVATASLRREGARLVPLYGWAFDIRGIDAPVVIRDGAAYGCTETAGCPSINEGGMTAFATGTPDGPGQPDVVYVVIRGSSWAVKLSDSPGWTLRLTRMRARTFEAQATGTTSARVADARIEHFESAVASGGSGGSVVIGTPPCRPAHRIGYFREGTGTARLVGGAIAATVDCSVPGSADAVGWAPTRTRWRFSGDVTGVGFGPTRMTVIDL